MRDGTAPYDVLASLFRYPDDGYGNRVRECPPVLEASSGEAAGHAAAFAAGVAGLERSDLEELYTRTFDLDPACCLDLGWHLYGEAYERGRFLVTLRGLLREHGVAENGELPDHLGHVLPLLGRMDPRAASRLAREAVAPALAVMCETLGKTDNPYRHLLLAARTLVREALIERQPEVCHD